jgi:type VI secretion system Hcp family effector
MRKKLLAILILSMSLLVSIGSPEPQMSMETNVDRPGMNYNNYPLSSADPQLCANDCANDPNCKAFTYVKPGFRGENSDPECWLKNGVPDPVTNEYCISGVKQADQTGDVESQPPLNLQLGFTAQNPDHTNLVLSSSDVAVDEAFILIPGLVPGTNSQQTITAQIKLFGFNYSIEGSEPGALQPGVLQVVKPIDRFSPQLYQLACNGKTLPYAELEIFYKDQSKMDYMLYDAVINSVLVLGGGVDKGQTPKEAITLKYNRIVWTYTPYDEKTGSQEAEISAEWAWGQPMAGSQPTPTPI